MPPKITEGNADCGNFVIPNVTTEKIKRESEDTDGRK